MSFAICRTTKLKSSELGAANSHNRRLADVPNADPDREIRTLTGAGSSIPELVADRIAASATKKPRKDAVHAVELFLSASPEWWRPEDPGRWGDYDPAKLEAWQARTEQFLAEKYGDLVVSVDLHLDEASPHIHAMVVPLAEKSYKIRGKEEWRNETALCAKDMFNPIGLQNLQSEYAASLADLGLHRGIKGSKAQHKTVKDFYRLMHSTPAPAPQVSPMRIEELPSKSVVFSATKMREWLDERTAEIQDRMAAAVERFAEAGHEWKQQALLWQRKYLASEQRLLAMCRDFSTPEGVTAALAAKDAVIASQGATIDDQAQTLSDHQGLLKQAQTTIEGLHGRVQVLEYENTQLTRNDPKAPSKGVDL